VGARGFLFAQVRGTRSCEELHLCSRRGTAQEVLSGVLDAAGGFEFRKECILCSCKHPMWAWRPVLPPHSRSRDRPSSDEILLSSCILHRHLAFQPATSLPQRLCHHLRELCYFFCLAILSHLLLTFRSIPLPPTHPPSTELCHPEHLTFTTAPPHSPNLATFTRTTHPGGYNRQYFECLLRRGSHFGLSSLGGCSTTISTRSTGRPGICSSYNKPIHKPIHTHPQTFLYTSTPAQMNSDCKPTYHTSYCHPQLCTHSTPRIPSCHLSTFHALQSTCTSSATSSASPSASTSMSHILFSLCAPPLHQALRSYLDHCGSSITKLCYTHTTYPDILFLLFILLSISGVALPAYRLSSGWQC